MSGANPFARFREVKSRSNRDVKPVLKSEPPAAKEPEQLQPSLPVSASPQFTDEEIPEVERVLRGFDLTSKYGPCAGMTRLERWERAHKFGLDPPEEIRQLLVQLGPNHPRNQAIWNGRV